MNTPRVGSASQTHPLRRHMRVCASALVLATLAACSSGDKPVSVPDPATVGAAGGTVTGPDGVQIVVPAGALLTEVTLRVAKDSTGAPAPADTSVLTPVSNTYALTPHGLRFRKPVTVRLPFDASQVAADEQLVILKAEVGGEWQVFLDVRRTADRVEAEFDGFSYYVLAVLTPVVASLAPFAIRIDALPPRPSPISQVRYTIGGSMPNCVGGGQYTTVKKDWFFRDAYDQYGFYAPASSSGFSYTETAVATAVVAASSRDFIGDYVATVLPADHQESTREFTIVVTHSREVVGSYKCLTITGTEVTFFSNAVQNPELYSFPPTRSTILYDGLQRNSSDSFDPLTVFESGWEPHARVIVRAITAENLPAAGVYWDRSDDQGGTWQQIGFASALGATLSMDFGPTTIPPALQYRLTLPAVRPADNGAQIRVRYCTSLALASCMPGATGPEYGVAHTLTVIVPSQAPVITEQPRSVIVGVGDTASLSVVATGVPQPTFQWDRWRPNPIPSLGTWIGIDGATSANYTTGVLSLGDSGAQFSVTARNPHGTAWSSIAVVTVVAPVFPSIGSQPLDLSVLTGSEALFAVAARGEALSYQWRFNGTAIQGANSPLLKLPAVTVANAGAYSVEVSNPLGSVSSVDATLTVTDVPTPVVVPPGIATQPAPVTVNAGNTATFAVGVGGTSPFSFQWRKNGVNIPGATAAAYTFTATSGDNGGEYSVQVGNSAGAVVSSAAALTVIATPALQAPTITTQPATLVLTPGTAATLAVAASGSGPLAYQWSRNGTLISGATGAVFHLASVTALDAGSYTVTVSNSAGNATSNAAQLILLGAPAITMQPASRGVSEGSTATFSVGATGNALLYQWARNNVAIAGATSASYTTPALTLADSGAVYNVIVYNGAGIVFSQGAVLTVTPLVIAPSVTQQPQDVMIEPGLPANLCMAFGGTLPMTVSMQRWVGDEWAPISSFPITSNSPFCTSTPNLQLADDGAQFLFIATNGSVLEAMTRVVTVTVSVVAPSVTQQPQDVRIDPGLPANVCMAFGGTLPMTVSMQRWDGDEWAPITSFPVTSNSAFCTSTPNLQQADDGAQFLFIATNGAVLEAMTRVVTVTVVGMTLYAGDFSGGGGGGALDGTGTAARFDFPEDLAADAAGNLYVAQSNGRRVSKIAPGAAVTTVLHQPIGTATNNFGAVALAPDASLYTAGISFCGLFRTEPPLAAGATTLEWPVTSGCGTETRGIAVDANGVVHLSLTSNNSIVRIGTVDGSGNYPASVLAGATSQFVPPGSADGTGTDARFSAPRGIAFGPGGDLFVADGGNHTIRRVTPAGVVTTFAGTAGSAGTVDDTGTAARFNTPTDLSFDDAGNLLVLERGSPANGFTDAFVRRITPGGVVTTLFDASGEAAALGTPAQMQFSRNLRGMVVLGPKRIALTAGNAIVIRTLH